MNRQRVLVTGASGFVGGHIALGLAKSGMEVFSTGGMHECPLEVRCASERVLSCDLTTPDGAEKLLRESKPDIIVHAAAAASPSACERDPVWAQKTNVEAVKSLIFRAAGMDTNPVIFHLSTDLVFDGIEAPPERFSEEDAPSSVTVYGKTKREGELLVLKGNEKSIVLRICLVYGSELGERQGFLTWMLSALRESKPLTLFNDEFRTPLFADDIPSAILAILNSGCLSSLMDSRAEHARIFHLPGPERLSRFDFAERLIELTGHSRKLLVATSLSEQQTGTHRSRDVSLSGEKLRAITGFRATPISEGLRCIFPDKGPD